MYIIKAQGEVIYAKYEVSRTNIAEGEQEVTKEIFEAIDVPCTLSFGADGTITSVPAEPPVIEGVFGPELEPPCPSLEEDMMTMIVDHEARLAAMEKDGAL